MLISAVTGWHFVFAGVVARVEQSSIVFFDNVTHIIHAAVADLDFVLVNNFVKLVMRREMLSKKVEEFFTDIILHMFAVWWIEPDYVSFSVPITLSAGMYFVGVADFVGGMATLAHGVRVNENSFRKLVLVA